MTRKYSKWRSSEWSNSDIVRLFLKMGKGRSFPLFVGTNLYGSRKTRQIVSRGEFFLDQIILGGLYLLPFIGELLGSLKGQSGYPLLSFRLYINNPSVGYPCPSDFLTLDQSSNTL